MKVFISGPMSNIPEFNFPAFHDAEERLKELGMEVLNPARLFAGYSEDAMPTRRECLQLSLEHLLKCDAIALLPGWEESKGAMLEVITATELDLQFYDGKTLCAMTPSIHGILDIYDRRKF